MPITGWSDEVDRTVCYGMQQAWHDYRDDHALGKPPLTRGINRANKTIELLQPDA
ncbi:hypothetical protein PENSUB_11897 [Penicillium subrubescens]|uniref:Uncharacterized protein n=1 Tax=Penicillium subrubescens TaxID=1316194 RepID=A0A1Q5T1M1_9EURO|nr:hypothetical protein PENSUB_11897 [Penicillium subrubescens]